MRNSISSGDRGEAMEGMVGRVEQVSLLKTDGRLRAFQLADPQTHRLRSVVLSKRIPCANYDGRSSNGMEHRRAGGCVDRQWSAAMHCAAGERALFTADADCGTARQLQQGTQR